MTKGYRRGSHLQSARAVEAEGRGTEKAMQGELPAFNAQSSTFNEASNAEQCTEHAPEFERVDNETKVARSFELNAKSMLTKPILWFISPYLKRAIARHLTESKHAAKES